MFPLLRGNDPLGSSAMTFEESLVHKHGVPGKEASELILLSSSSRFSHTDPVVDKFLVGAVKEVLDDSRVLADIDKCLRAGSGVKKTAGHSCCDDHGHQHKSQDIISEMITSLLGNGDSLSRLGPRVIAKASQTFRNVLARGRAEGQSSMDSGTAK